MDCGPHLARHCSQADLDKRNNIERHHEGVEFHRESIGTFNQGSFQQYQYYSFNKGLEEHQKDSQRFSNKSVNQSSSDQLNTFRSNHDLKKKYSSLYDQLKSLQPNEMARILVEEIEENERYQKESKEHQRRERWLESQIEQLREQLAQKREVVRKLCETETRNLDLIQNLQCQASRKGWNPSDHYFAKYSQLQSYMNQYICSTKEAQEQMLKTVGQLHSQKSRLLAENDSLSHALFQRAKLVGILEVRLVRAESSVNKEKQCDKLLQKKLDRLEQQNNILKKEIESLIQTIKSYEQFQVDINNKSNREVSSSLQFIRERLNINLSLSQDRHETPTAPRLETGKNNFNSKAEETEALRVRIFGLNEEREKLLAQNSQLMQDYQKLCQRVQALTKDNVRLGVLTDQGNRTIQKLKVQMGKNRKMQEQLEQQLQRKDRNLHQKSTNITDSLDLSSLKIARNSQMSCLQVSLYNTKPAFTRLNGGYNHYESKEKENESVKSINLN